MTVPFVTFFAFPALLFLAVFAKVVYRTTKYVKAQRIKPKLRLIKTDD